MNRTSPFATLLQLAWPQVFGTRIAFGRRNSQLALVQRARESASKLSRLTDKELEKQSADLRNSIQSHPVSTGDDQLVAGCMLVVEAARRVLGIELYDVQLLAGLAISRGAIAEMQTGEGKTFAVLLPAYIHALTGLGVHVMTVNSYLAIRDHELLAPAFRLLGLSVGVIHAEVDESAKRAAYRCDITYGPGYEFGFDYLRDQMAVISSRRPALGESFRRQLRGGAVDRPQPMQRGRAIAIVDEADSVMIDEATTPLILSAGPRKPAPNADTYRRAAKLAAKLRLDVDYVLDRSTETLQLTSEGHMRLAAYADEMPRQGLNRPWSVYVEQALRAEWIYRQDVHYIVSDDKIQLVDQCTGRIFSDRSWNEGLEQAVQTKAGVTITTETSSIARITRQRYFGLYQRCGGMTGTAQSAAGEFRDLYGLDVVRIPTHRPCQRKMLPVRAFASRDVKERALVAALIETHHSRRPVLVGTAAIETSERLAGLLDNRQIPYRLLNGKQDASEAAIVANAGQAGMVTIATNMAGRGTDIRLGPNIAEIGGLHVIASEPQFSERVDRQLVGRAARQGDPGSYQLFVAADDNLLVRHAPGFAARMRKSADDSGEVHLDVAGEIRAIQRRVENEQAAVRRRMFDHDSWLESLLADLEPM